MTKNFNYSVGPMIPHFTGALSMMGSGWIIFEILRERRVRLKRSYHRIMLCLSAFDFLSSFAFFASVWASTTSPWKSEDSTNGSIASCNASGFFVQLGVVSIPLYNATLAMYFLLMIKYNWREEKIWKRFERVAHALIIPTAFVLAIIPLPLDLYNPYYFYCFPVNKAASDGAFGGGSGEARGTPTQAAFYFYLFYVVVTFSTVVVTGIMVMITFHVVNQSKRNHRYDFERNNSNRSIQSTHSLSASSVGSNQSTRSRARRPRDAKTRIVTRNALLYTIPFYITWVLPAIFMLVTRLAFANKTRFDMSQTAAYVMYIYICTALPIQGFVNWIIYMQPVLPSLYEKVFGSCSCNLITGLIKKYCSRPQTVNKSNDASDTQKEEKERDVESSLTTTLLDKIDKQGVPGTVQLELKTDSQGVPGTHQIELKTDCEGAPGTLQLELKEDGSELMVVAKDDDDDGREIEDFESQSHASTTTLDA